jgi:hypothetical protein
MEPMSFDAARVRIQIHYIEMPGLRLSSSQVSRLCGVSDDVCTEVLGALVRSGFLARGTDGSFLRCGLQRTDLASRSIVGSN